MMILPACPVLDCRIVGRDTFVLSFAAPAIARIARAGQFVNIKVDIARDPLLRRPFSISRIDGDAIEVLFNIVGKGTDVLAHKKVGEVIDVLGPLGVGYRTGNVTGAALLVSGGLGVAPMPFLTTVLRAEAVTVHNFVGARSAAHLVTQHLENVHTATDDGSAGFHGSVVQCVDEFLNANEALPASIFACGPNRMLLALAELAARRGLHCEAALECAMACGIGICQGCPVEMIDGPRKFNLVCKDGPVFDVGRVVLRSLL